MLIILLWTRANKTRCVPLSRELLAIHFLLALAGVSLVLNFFWRRLLILSQWLVWNKRGIILGLTSSEWWVSFSLVIYSWSELSLNQRVVYYISLQNQWDPGACCSEVLQLNIKLFIWIQSYSSKVFFIWVPDLTLFENF